MSEVAGAGALAGLQDEQIVRLKVVEQLTSLSRATLYRKIKKRTFPKPVSLSDNRVGWRVRELRAWLAQPM